jgi:vancomycin permeability regulator SanA
MIRGAVHCIRPFGVAFGCFAVLNLALAIQDPRLPVTATWLGIGLPEPDLSLLSGVLGAALLVPHRMGAALWLRSLLGGTFAGFAVLAGAATWSYYRKIHAGELATDLPIPASLLLVPILASELIRVHWWRPASPLVPPPARVLLGGVSVTLAFLVLTLAHVITYGHEDHRGPADAAVILGAKVGAGGRPCAALADRLDTGIELFRRGLVRYLIMSGAVDARGRSEPLAMRAYAEARGVPAARIILDEGGFNTRASALGSGAIARKRGFKELLAVTQYFHCARVKLVFDREGTPCRTVPTCSLRKDLTGVVAPVGSPRPRLQREAFFLIREAMAFPYYLVVHTRMRGRLPGRTGAA